MTKMPKTADAPTANLTLRQQHFVTDYVQHGNASAAARAAGYSDRREGHRLLQHPKVAAVIRMVRERGLPVLAAAVRESVRPDRPSVPVDGVDSSRIATAGAVYVVAAPLGRFKIGASRNPRRRVRELQAEFPYDLEVVMTIRSDDVFRLEHQLHERFAAKRLRREWFALDPADIAALEDEFGLWRNR